MTSTSLFRGELLLTPEEANDFNKNLENACLDIYGLNSQFIPWRVSPIDQPIRAHTPSSISLATVLRELDATIDPAEIIKQPLNRRSSFKVETSPSPRPTTPPSPKKAPEVKPEVKRRPTFVLDEKIEYDMESDFYKLLHPPEDKLNELPDWARRIHKILKDVCYQPCVKPFLKYFKNKKLNALNSTETSQSAHKSKKSEKSDKGDDLDFDDLSDDLHDILMDIDDDANTAAKDAQDKKELDSEVTTPQNVDNYVKINNLSVEDNADAHKTQDLTQNHDTNNEKANKDSLESTTQYDTQPNQSTKDETQPNQSTTQCGTQPNQSTKDDTQLNQSNSQSNPKLNDQKNPDPEVRSGKVVDNKPKELDLENILESLLMNEFENSSKVFSLIYLFLVKQFKVIPPGTLEWMCAQDMSIKLDELRIAEGLMDSEKLHSFPDDTLVPQVIPPPLEPAPPEIKKARTSMEDFEHEIALINKSDDYNSTISLPEVKNITDEERMEFYSNVTELDQEYQLELFTVFEHAAVWKIVGNGEIELDDRNTDPKIYRGMLKWVKEKKKVVATTFQEPEIDLSQMTSEIAV
ncbi:hypothetical protein TpMuguga_01g00941 [Theileria parva strain Muguga]|uniref:Uncharacterized protein n=1 Tax=Theileria parva TaxID=5875 RepID=Q4N779_THEPA|nr:uncharacterized protein TpMuguga_01g00941 [Theileria parva strain Muguga]EAN34179.1 hypothetical protein TpMuguga_01g00941 [Theileria parva strain Muguga]|eukprot:XP_766462.1 hypothetical protein [Theileria parva strain Muguga]